MKNLFKTITLALAMIASTSVFAQSGKTEVGVNFGYQTGSKGMNNPGIGIKVGHMFSDALRVELGGMYYFKSSNVKADDILNNNMYKDGNFTTGKSTDWFDIDLNAHYLFNVGSNFNIYPIFGFTTMFGHTSFDMPNMDGVDAQYVTDKELSNIITSNFIDENTGDFVKKHSDHHFRFGVNLGFGAQYSITDDFAVTLEAKYKLIKDFGNFNVMLGCAVLF